LTPGEWRPTLNQAECPDIGSLGQPPLEGAGGWVRLPFPRRSRAGARDDVLRRVRTNKEKQNNHNLGTHHLQKDSNVYVYLSNI
jgi:hypothetical protein